LDASSDRDFAIEAASALALVALHLSTWAEEWIIWSTSEFSFIKLPQAFCTGSSIMPQKVNPDVLELVRAKTARVIGNVTRLMVLVKGLPLAYNRDLQEDKLPMFEVVSTTRQCLFLFAHLLVHTTFNRHHMEEELRNDFLTATELADYLVRKGIPFREAHAVVGRVVSHCIDHRMYFGNLDLDTLHTFSKAFGEDVFDYLLPHRSVEQKKSAGSTSPQEVKKQIVHWTRVLKGRKL
ncbi:MAG: argininosuccinate lyase, partial [Bacteroidota bacterium]